MLDFFSGITYSDNMFHNEGDGPSSPNSEWSRFSRPRGGTPPEADAHPDVDEHEGLGVRQPGPGDVWSPDIYDDEPADPPPSEERTFGGNVHPEGLTRLSHHPDPRVTPLDQLHHDSTALDAPAGDRRGNSPRRRADPGVGALATADDAVAALRERLGREPSPAELMSLRDRAASPGEMIELIGGGAFDEEVPSASPVHVDADDSPEPAPPPSGTARESAWSRFTRRLRPSPRTPDPAAATPGPEPAPAAPAPTEDAGDFDPEGFTPPEPASVSPDADASEDVVRVAGRDFIVKLQAMEEMRAEERKRRLDVRIKNFFTTGAGGTLLKMIPHSHPRSWPADLRTSWKSKLGEVLWGTAISQGSKYAVRAGLIATGFEGYALLAAVAGGGVAEAIKEGRKMYNEQDSSLAARDKLKSLWKNKTRLGRAGIRGGLYSALGYYGAEILAEHAPDVMNSIVETAREKAGEIKAAIIGSLSLGDPAALPWDSPLERPDVPAADAPTIEPSVEPTQVPTHTAEAPTATPTHTPEATATSTATATATATQESATATPTSAPATPTPAATSAPAVEAAPPPVAAPIESIPDNSVPGFTSNLKPPPANLIEPEVIQPSPPDASTIVAPPAAPAEVIPVAPLPADAVVDGAPVPGSTDVVPVVDQVVSGNPALAELNLDQFSPEVQDALKNVPDHYTLPANSGENPWSAARYLLEQANPDAKFNHNDVMKVAIELCRENDISYGDAGIIGSKDPTNLFGENAILKIGGKSLEVMAGVLQSK